jgi:hypothetical protein
MTGSNDAGSGSAPEGLRAGADARPITPDLDRHTVFLAGFEPDRPARSVHDDLMVRTLAVAGGGHDPIVISVCDLVGLTRTHDDTGSRIVACTHTHHGPDGLGFWGQPFEGVSGIDADYIEGVRDTIAASQAAAVANLEPAVLVAGAVAVPELVLNHRNPDVLDDELSAVRLLRPDGTTIATFVDYACHPEVVAAESTDVTADFPGHLCRRIESTSGGVAVFAVGALGGMQSPRTEVRTHAEAERFGAVLAEAVERAIAGDRPVDPGDAPRLGFARDRVTFELQNPIYELGMELGLVPAAERAGDEVVTEVSYARIGPVGIACAPGELFPEFGIHLKQSMRDAGVLVPIVVGLADDELGYLLPEADFTAPEDYLDPGSSYEESFSAGPEAGPRVVEALDRLIATT